MAAPCFSAISLIKKLVIALSLVLVLCLLVNGHDHGHSHEHSDEPPAHKYSKAVNEEATKVAQDAAQETDSQDARVDSHAHSHNHGHSHDGDERLLKPAEPNADAMLWLKALAATALVSIAPIFLLLIIPVEDANDEKHRPLLKILLAFASGGLLGDAFLHLIPHAVSPHSNDGGAEREHSHSGSHGHSHEHGGHDLSVGLWVLAGIIAFLMVEKFVRLVKGDHGHSHGGKSPSAKSQNTPKEKKDYKKKKEKASDDEEECSDEEEKPVTHAERTTANQENMKIAGYLNLAADFAHNFTDGLAIGASFLAGHTVGVITTVTILLHEVPHEIGDFAILVQSGCSKRKAMMLQFSTAIGAMCGTVVSLLAGGISSSATAFVLPFTAGGFIYIATVSVIPELLKDTKFWQSVKEIIALLIGVYMMVLIAKYE